MGEVEVIHCPRLQPPGATGADYGLCSAVKFVQTGVVTPYARVCGKRPRLHKLHSNLPTGPRRLVNGGATLASSTFHLSISPSRSRRVFG